MHAGTVRTNVCFESSYRRERYFYIMKGCCLDEDFCLFEKTLGDEIGSTFGMDEEDIGQGGSRLSGGQRLRVGIARALYAPSNIILLDDPFSALDRRTSERLMSFLLSISQLEKRVILLVTNEIHMLQTGVTSIIFLNRGKVEGTGTFEQLYNSLETFRNMIEKTVKNVIWTESMENLSPSDITLGETEGKESEKENRITEIPAVEESEHMGRGEIEGRVVRAYFRAAGYGVVFLVLCATLMMQVTQIHCNCCLLLNPLRLQQMGCLFGWLIGLIILIRFQTNSSSSSHQLLSQLMLYLLSYDLSVLLGEV